MVEMVVFGAICCLFLACAAVDAGELPEQYREPFSKSYPIRQQQHLELKAFLDRLTAESEDRRAAFFRPDFSSPAAYERSLALFREQFHRILGYPPPEATADPKPRFELAGRDRHADIYRVWVEVMNGVDAYGIYMVPRVLKGKAPLLIAQHGGSGCPEAVCDLDTRVNYHSFGPVEVAGLICPRPLMIQNGVNDPVIPVEGARRGAPMVAEFYKRLGLQERFVYFEHDGGHEFHNESIFAFFEKHLK